MWRLLHRNQESVLVGTAVTLVVLALLAHGRTWMDTPAGAQGEDLLANSGQSDSATGSSIPTDPEYYAAKWRKIASDFYALHPVDDATEPNGVEGAESIAEVVNAALTDHSGANKSSWHPVPPDTVMVKPVSHTQLGGVAAPIPTESSIVSAAKPALAKRVAVVGKPSVAAAIAAGLLAFFWFRYLWPNQAVEKPSLALSVSSDPSDQVKLIRMELPSDWVQIRPPFRQRLKSAVLAISYIVGGIAAWAIL